MAVAGYSRIIAIVIYLTKRLGISECFGKPITQPVGIYQPIVIYLTKRFGLPVDQSFRIYQSFRIGISKWI